MQVDTYTHITTQHRNTLSTRIISPGHTALRCAPRRTAPALTCRAPPATLCASCCSHHQAETRPRCRKYARTHPHAPQSGLTPQTHPLKVHNRKRRHGSQRPKAPRHAPTHAHAPQDAHARTHAPRTDAHHTPHTHSQRALPALRTTPLHSKQTTGSTHSPAGIRCAEARYVLRENGG